jgi:hypothetical protein
VADHKRPRAFVADVLLYDRLVIPVPPQDDVEAWHESGWEPAELSERLDILGTDLVRQVPWDPAHRRRFREQYAQEEKAARAAERLHLADEVEFDAENIRTAKAAGRVDSMGLTRLILVDHANQKRDQEFFDEHPDVYVEALVAYPSFTVFNEEQEVQPLRGRLTAGESQLAGVFGWEFFVPEDPNRSDLDLLAEAATLAHRKSFREARTDFHVWRRELVEHGVDAKTALAI